MREKKWEGEFLLSREGKTIVNGRKKIWNIEIGVRSFISDLGELAPIFSNCFFSSFYCYLPSVLQHL